MAAVSVGYDAFYKNISTGAVNSKRKGLTVLHTDSDKGFFSGGLLYFESSKNTKKYHVTNSDNFNNWFKRILPKHERNSVIVMDTVPYNSNKLEEPPSSTQKKQDIVDWFQSNGETFDRSIPKLMLLEHVRQIKSKFSTFFIDSIAQNAGHNI
ncbi:uncharacterized protein LOC112604301 [Melanaphis sacchari]|uniref:uncharacterized protein LOC112604301 n=1 Tax=Melanaphis sacchari TaxID=742174 RepID=UPI000DC12FB0|nr:uncharacterized protein LOC112604301 [Melanaphis sacchari]